MGGGREMNKLEEWTSSQASSDTEADDVSTLEGVVGTDPDPTVKGATRIERESENAEVQSKLPMQSQRLKRQVEELRVKLQRRFSYKPGDWLVEAGGMKKSDFDIPETTTLLLVGTMGAGKSTLVNNIVRVLNNKTHDFDRAQVCGESGANGTYFLTEYMVCQDRSNICVFDSRGIPEVETADSLALLKNWMVQGVCNGQMVIRDSDSSLVREMIEIRGMHGHHKLSKNRTVNFVIFVVDAVSVHKMHQTGDKMTCANLSQSFEFPYTTFIDDRPVVVMTHGDELSDSDRLDTLIFLSNLLGVSWRDIFDIAGFTGRQLEQVEDHLSTDLVLLDMLDFALQRAERHFPAKVRIVRKVWEIAAKGYNDLDSRQQLVLIGLGSCWVLLFALLVMASLSISGV